MTANQTDVIINQLQRSLSKMELSLGAINEIIVWLNKDGIIQWCNERFAQLIQHSHIEILGNPIFEFLPPFRQKGQTIPWQEIFIKRINRRHIYETEINEKKLFLEVDSNIFQEIHEDISIVVVIQDVTEKQLSNEKIEFLAAFPENNPAPILSVNKEKKITYANQAAVPLINYWQKKFEHDIPIIFYSLVEKVIETRHEFVIEEIYDHQIFLFSITPSAAPDYVNIYATNITERKKAEEELVFYSNHDMLTKLYNRPAFEKALREQIIRSEQKKTAFAILLIDLDHFKSINDTFGHHIGDQLLVLVAKQLQESIRKDDIVARIGGDEFIIILPDIKNTSDVNSLANKLLKRFNKPFKLESHYFTATLSIGIAVAPPIPGHNEITLIKNADLALYAVKETGRNNYQIFSEKIGSAFKRRSDLEAGFSDAINKNQLYLVYQPQYKLPDRILIGMEALLRWHHPELGEIMPNDFIPLAEKNGFIIPIGEWVLKTACSQYMLWKSQRISDDIKLAINLSPAQVAKSDFIDSLKKILNETKMPPQNLELELTETAVMTNIIDLDPVFEELQKLNIKISIDDFGAGYSSLSRLRNLPVSTLKIDKSFIDDLNNPDDAIIVKSIIALGENLGLQVITEGVEQEEQLQQLLKYNCSIVQGFYFGKRPLTSDEMTRLLKDSIKSLPPLKKGD